MKNMEISKKIEECLWALKDEEYGDFCSRLTPGLMRQQIIGVRTPCLRKLAKELSSWDGIDTFLQDLPHYYYEENQLHSFLISAIKDFDICLAEVEKFLPYVDNWAVCDQLSPPVFKKHKKDLLDNIGKWLSCEHEYTVRFGLGMLMRYYLDEDFDPSYLELAASVHSEYYYSNMMLAWYFATALAKQYPAAVAYLQEVRLSPWVHNKTIRKAIESYRISDEQKAYLRTLCIK